MIAMQPSIEKILKFLKLEIERGYDNRAVVGGLERVLPIWETEARLEKIPEDTIIKTRELIAEYTLNSTQEERAQTIKTLWQELTRTSTGIQPSIPAEKPRKVSPPPLEKPASPSVQVNYSAQSKPPARSASNGPGTGLNAPLTVVQGIGAKHAETLAGLGLQTLEDLLYYFPRRYDDYSQLKPISRLFYGEEVTIIGAITSVTTRPIKGGSSHIIEAILTDGTGSLRLTWFNQLWIANRLKSGMQVVVSGRVDQYLGRLMMSSPEWEQLETEQLHTNRIVPVYPLTASITQKWLRRLQFQTVQYWSQQIDDFLPDAIRTGYHLPELGTALKEIHFPSGHESLNNARKRLAFDEIFLLQIGVLKQKRSWKSATAAKFSTPDDQWGTWLERLPYQLTNAQSKVLGEIREDLMTGQPMNRLLQGDVGSGKTVVAALGMAIVLTNGGQAALMAPTSILAEQHFRSLTRLLSDDEKPNPILQPEEIRLLIGDTKPAEKESIREDLAGGKIKLIIGTHALIEDPLVFQNLQMVVVDEQHRFGVEQRALLRAKGTNPHLLVMTATPIPRSLALTVYGDLDLSVMDEFPAGRQEIETQVLFPREREAAYLRIESQVDAGRQAFIIYPLVEQGDNDEAKAAVEECERLQKEVFRHYRLGLLHGRLKPEEKDAVMTQFRNQEIDILVSTSVVEVGVDIPNATMMLVEGANRFGLAQLHQFRGRVGRGEHKSYCLLIPETENAADNERLKAMAETNDGFVLAEKDLEQRGPGDFLGTRQAGFGDLRLASLTDVRLIEKAREAAQQVFDTDPEMTNSDHTLLAQTLQRFWKVGKGDIS
jgi:ATP-dependent DNA helicase RecG